MSLKNIATDFGADAATARRDAERLSGALGQPVLLWLESGKWWALPAAKAVGKDLDFQHELINYK